MGAAAQFNVTVRGKGGHAAMPHTTVDPVVAGAAVVTALQVGSAPLQHRVLCPRLFCCCCNTQWQTRPEVWPPCKDTCRSDKNLWLPGCLHETLCFMCTCTLYAHQVCQTCLECHRSCLMYVWSMLFCEKSGCC